MAEVSFVIHNKPLWTTPPQVTQGPLTNQRVGTLPPSLWGGQKMETELNHVFSEIPVTSVGSFLACGHIKCWEDDSPDLPTERGQS